MEYPTYNSLVYQVQSLEDKLNQITKNTRDYHDASAVNLSKKPHHYESIQNLLELAKNIKRELSYSLKCNPKDRKTSKMYDKVCILESELRNLVNCNQPFQNTSRRPRACGSKEVPGVPMEVSSDYSEDFPNRRYSRRISFASQEMDTSSSDSFDKSSYYFLSSESSSSMETIDKKRKPLYLRKSSSSYQTQPSTLRTERRTPERIPIYVDRSRSSYKRKKDKRERNMPKLKKKSSLKFGMHKSDSNKINVDANNLQTQESEVFFIKKKRKPSKPREQSSKSPNSERYFISRLRRVLSSKIRPHGSKRNKSQRIRKSSTPEYREEKLYIKKHGKSRLGVSKYKENDPNLEDTSPKYSEDTRRRKKKPSLKRFGSKENIKPRRSRDSNPVQRTTVTPVVRSSNLNDNPFYDQKQIFYLQDSNFVLFPKKLSSKEDRGLPRNRGSGELNSKDDKETINKSFVKPVKISYSHKNNNIYNTEYNHGISTPYQNSNLYVQEDEIPPSTRELKTSIETDSKYRAHSNTNEDSQKNSGVKKRNTDDSFNYKQDDDYNSKMSSKSNRKLERKWILRKVVNDVIPLIENERSSTKNCTNSKPTSITAKLSLNKRKSFHSNPFEDNTTGIAPPIYLATVSHILAKSSDQNLHLLRKITEYKVDYIVNTALKNVQNQEFPNSTIISNLNHSTSPQSSPSEKTTDVKHTKIHTFNKSGSKTFPFKTVSKGMQNSNTESRGPTAPLQNTKRLSREYSSEGVQPTLRNESPTDVSSVGSNQSSTSKKIKKWFPRSLSKLSMLSKRSKKAKGDKDSKSLKKEDSKSSLPHLSKQGSKDKHPSSDKVSKTNSWTSFKRTMSGIGGLSKSSKTKKTENQAALKRVESEKKLKKQPSLLKRMFSRENPSKPKARMSNATEAELEISSTGPIGTSGYEADKASSISILHHPPNTKTDEHLTSNKLNGYQVGSKMGKNKGSNIKKDKEHILPPSLAKSKKSALKDNPNAFNYSMHYSKEIHKCVGMDLAQSSLSLVNRKCCPQTVVKTCGSKNLWSMGKTVLSEQELSEFEKHNKYCEFYFKPNNCRGCEVRDKKVSKVFRERGERKSLDSLPLNKISKHDNDLEHTNYAKSIAVTKSDSFLSDGSDICDWKKIADEIKEIC